MPELTRSEIRKVLKRHKAMGSVARSLKVHTSTVASVLRGRAVSARIMQGARLRALEILAEENSAAKVA